MIAKPHVTTRLMCRRSVLLAAALAALALAPARAAEKLSTVAALAPSAPARVNPASGNTAGDNTAKPPATPVVTAPVRPSPRVKSEAEEIQDLRQWTRITPKLSGGCGGYDRIGALTAFPFWTKTLPLAKEQIRTINMMEAVVGESRELSFYNDADYPSQSLAQYQAYLNRNHPRRLAAMKHAQRIVAMGLLTEQQAEFVLHRYAALSRPSYSFDDDSVHETLGLTPEQRKALTDTWEHARLREARLNLFSIDPKVQKTNQAEMTANSKDADAATLALLTPSQRLIWSRITADRELPHEPPALPALADLEAAREKLRQERPLFRLLGRVPSRFDESGYQRRLLRDLEEVTATGLFWIGLSKSPSQQVAERRAAFLAHAEQFALTGILTEEQATQAEKNREIAAARERASESRR